MTWLWGLLAALALLWPDRVSGPFDGAPLDRIAEAVLVAGIFPALWWFHPGFLKMARARLHCRAGRVEGFLSHAVRAGRLVRQV